MTSDPGRKWHVHFSAKEAESLRAIQRQASKPGRGVDALAAFQSIAERLQTDPLAFGEPLFSSFPHEFACSRSSEPACCPFRRQRGSPHCVYPVGETPFSTEILIIRRSMDVKVTYLEMFGPPHRGISTPREGLAVLHAKKPPIPYYRFLYDRVGGAYHWYSRKKPSDTELAVIIGDPRVEVHVIHVEGVPAGFAELDRRKENEIELTQFGLVPEFIGQGLGKYFLQWTIDKAWSYQPKRFWLHTCTLDHPRALPNYKSAGFAVYKEEIIQREI